MSRTRVRSSLAGVPEQRKTVTILFCDLTGSTALGESVDPERLRALLARYFERMGSIVERHGGSVEKFIGDAVMAVFGVPLVHEDDALRAVRAASEMREALPDLGLQGRIGVMTGEVVTGTEERLATGDAVNVAARLEQAAPPGEVLIGQPTLELVRGAADVEPVEPLELKGKSKPVPAFRLVSVRDAPERRHGARFVGRERELELVREAWKRVRAGKHCELVTVIGDAGVGKSRLAAELLGSIDATVARGRCLPYGDGITYWPVVEVLKQLDVLPPDETAAGPIRTLLGESDAATTPDEIAWAFRKTLEHAAGDRALVVLFEDIQWAEETFLDLVEHVALLSSGAAILLLCLARPDLVERRPTWPDLRERRAALPVTLRLEPLAADSVHELIPESIAGDLRERIVRAAGGIPLFAQEMVAMAGETEGEVVVPPNLQALLAARLDQLETNERDVLERGAVEGETFHRGAVQALAAAQVNPHLAALVRKQLIRTDRAVLADEDGFRFRHLLIRDAAYNGLPKGLRAELHERFARWLEERGADLVELDEIVGHHLEQAIRYRSELGMPSDAALSEDARRRLTAAGHGRTLGRTKGRPSASSGAPLRSFRRTRSTSRSRPTSHSACSRPGTWTTRSNAPARSPSARRRREIGWVNSAGGSGNPHSTGRSTPRVRPTRSPRSSRRRCRCSRRRATTSPSRLPTSQRLRWRPSAGRWTLRRRRRTSLWRAHGVRGACRSSWAGDRPLASTGRRRCRTSSSGSRSRTRAGSVSTACGATVPRR